MEAILDDLRKYFSEKITKHGPLAKGVDWRDGTSQEIRFRQLLKIVTLGSKIKINDLGCGYAGLFKFMRRTLNRDFIYRGYDISNEMVKAAKSVNRGGQGFQVKKINRPSELKPADYTVASGIFNNKFTHSNKEWKKYILQTLSDMNKASQIGFSFNALTIYSDKEKMRKDLYYADPNFLFDFCKRNFAQNVAVLHDYGLYEFTLLVRKKVL